MQEYEITPGFSITTKTGVAHCGAIVSVKNFSDEEEAEKYLASLEESGKIKKVVGDEDKKEETQPNDDDTPPAVDMKSGDEDKKEETTKDTAKENKTGFGQGAKRR